MRASGIVGESVALEDADHVCWVDDGDAFPDAAIRFLTVGLARGERLLWIGGGAEERLRTSGSPLAAVDQLTASGTLQLTPVDAAYGGLPLVPAEQVRFYAEETRRALADGYRGLRAVAEVTPLVAGESDREVFLAWEHLCDRLVASGSGLSVLCVYRPAGTPPAVPPAVPRDVVAEAGARHPVVHPAASGAPFRVWFDGDTTVVAGDLDTFGAGRFLRIVADDPADGVARMDLRRLTFVDLAGVRAVGSWARRRQEQGAAVELVGAPRLFGRMWQLHGFADRLPVRFAEASA